MKIAARDFFQKNSRIDDLEIIGAERAQPHDAEILVAQHHRVGGAPLVAGKQARGDVIHVGLERRFKTVFPALELGQHRNVIGNQRVFARLEGIAKFTEVDKLRHLRFAHNQLRAVFDRLVFVGKAIRQRVAGIIRPLDNVEQFAFNEIHQCHVRFSFNNRPSIKAITAANPSNTRHRLQNKV